MPELHSSRRVRRLRANPWLIFAVIGLGSFLGPLSGSIVNVALPTIAKDYQADIQSAKWVVLVYLLVATFLLPLAGKWGQRYGEGRLYILGFAIYGLASALAAMSSHASLYGLVGARALQAVGSSLLFATGAALATHYVPRERRGLAFGMIGSIVAVALVTGPLVGGIICARSSWPWIFWVLVPVAAAGFVSSLVLVPRERFEHDYGSFPVLSSLFWFMLVSGLTLMGEAFSKGLWYDYLWLTTSATVISLALFVVSERRGPSLFDYSMFRITAFNLGMQGAVMVSLVVFIMVLFLPFMLEDYMGMPIEHIGMLLGISPLCSFITAPLSGHLSDRVGFRLPIISGLAMLAAGFFFLAASIDQSVIWEIGLAMALMGAGSGMYSGPNFAAMMGSVAVHQRSLASSIASLTRNIGFLAGTSMGSIGLGYFLTVFGGRQLMLAARSEVLSPATVPTAAFHYAFSHLLVICAVLTLAGLVISLRFPNRLEHSTAE